jgi:ribosome-associated heat shock protein Hsp15
MDGGQEHARLDRWLWATRLFKTRALAAKAVDGGRVEVNDEKAKPAKALRPGDLVRVRIGPYEYRVTVRALDVRRGNATQAATLYEEEPASRERRERIAEQHRLAARMSDTRNERPSKRDRRAIGKLKGRE